MPVEKVGNKYRWGKNGKLYRDKGKAMKQAVAIEASKERRGEKPEFHVGKK
jgi:hypothetical protein